MLYSVFVQIDFILHAQIPRHAVSVNPPQLSSSFHLPYWQLTLQANASNPRRVTMTLLLFLHLHVPSGPTHHHTIQATPPDSPLSHIQEVRGGDRGSFFRGCCGVNLPPWVKLKLLSLFVGHSLSALAPLRCLSLSAWEMLLGGNSILDLLLFQEHAAYSPTFSDPNKPPRSKMSTSYNPQSVLNMLCILTYTCSLICT